MAGEAADDDVDSRESCSGGFADIGHAPICVGPVALEDPARVLAELYLPENIGREGDLDTTVEAAPSGEQGADGGHARCPSTAARYLRSIAYR